MKRLVALAIVGVAVSALTLSFAFVLYSRASECPSYAVSGSAGIGIVVVQEGTNWTATLAATPRGLVPESTWAEISNSSDGTDLLGQTAWSALTDADWARQHALYDDRHPGVRFICGGDRLVIGVAQYPDGSALRIWDERTIIADAVLT